MKIIINEKIIDKDIYYSQIFLFLSKKELIFEEEIKQELDLNFQNQFKIIKKIY